jgi:hypothetical protein
MPRPSWSRAVVVLAVTLSTTLATVVGMSATAYATSIEDVPVTVEASGAKISVMPHAIDDGDCRMKSTFLRIDPPAADGSSLVTWEGTAFTRHTNNADIWNLFMNVGDADGDFLFSLPALHSDRMTKVNRDYTWTRFVRIQLSREEFDRIGQMHWIGTC